jgi:hypothetical protein
MTVSEAIGEVQRVGVVEVSGGNLRLKFPESMRAALQPAIDTLRTGKAEALARLAEMNLAELARGSAVLKRAGVRIMALAGGATIGVWSDLDGPEVRAALRTFGSERLPVRYLDGAGVPMWYKARGVDGEPVPMNVLNEMERHPADPWKVRDRMLSEMGWCAKGTPWAEWKAAALNRLFQEHGATGKPGRITAATVRHGERKAGGNG